MLFARPNVGRARPVCVKPTNRRTKHSNSSRNQSSSSSSSSSCDGVLEEVQEVGAGECAVAAQAAQVLRQLRVNSQR